MLPVQSVEAASERCLHSPHTYTLAHSSFTSVFISSFKANNRNTPQLGPVHTSAAQHPA